MSVSDQGDGTKRKAGVEARRTGCPRLGMIFLPVPGRSCGRALSPGDCRLPVDGHL